ncbi:uncharacterized protein [Triticum aestivum]|uniref:uncharacterized protein n=1 Tax=Triticum aestivum TaxID=4565 RepID=UPI001D01D230|nr:uncharacterized protein LOC123077395 [Triticum aestivum]
MSSSSAAAALAVRSGAWDGSVVNGDLIEFLRKTRRLPGTHLVRARTTSAREILLAPEEGEREYQNLRATAFNCNVEELSKQTANLTESRIPHRTTPDPLSTHQPSQFNPTLHPSPIQIPSTSSPLLCRRDPLPVLLRNKETEREGKGKGEAVCVGRRSNGGQAEPGAGAVHRRPRGAAHRGRRGEGPARRIRLHRLLRLPLRPHSRGQRGWRGQEQRLDSRAGVAARRVRCPLSCQGWGNCPGGSAGASSPQAIRESGSGSSSKDTRIIDRAFTLLGFAEGNVQDASEFDLGFVHAAMENTSSKLGKLGMKMDLNRLDKLVASIMEAAPLGSAVAARIHVSVILSYGSATANKEHACLILNSSTEIDSDLKLLCPQISLLCISCRNHHPMLLAQWQQGVTRSDLAKEFLLRNL